MSHSSDTLPLDRRSAQCGQAGDAPGRDAGSKKAGFEGAASGIRIGNRVIASRYFLAPLAGYTHLAFRRALRELGGLGLATTDLVHATSLISGNQKSLSLIVTHPDDRPLSIQIFGSKPDVLARAAVWLEGRGYSGIDINMGCPMAKVNGQGGGARIACQFESSMRSGFLSLSRCVLAGTQTH
jgi:hypothetical protein